MLLNKKTALVTGAGSGLGRAISEKLASEGCILFLVGRNQRHLEETCQTIQNSGGSAFCFSVDLTDDTQLFALSKEILSQHGCPDILVNNAGLSKEYPLMDMPIEVWDEIYNINLRSVMMLTKAFLPYMAERRSGNIVNIGSGAALRGLPGSIAYAVSKAGVVCFTQTLGDEIRRYGLRTNVICPGPVDTEMFQQSDIRDYILSAGGDLFSPETVANAVLFLASDLSEGMNSQILTMRGFNRW